MSMCDICATGITTCPRLRRGDVSRGAMMVALRSLRPSAPSFADLVPYAGLVDNGIILLKDGSLMAGWYFAGPDSESATDFERNELSRQINTILSRLGSGWMIQVEAVRIPTTDYPSAGRSHFPDAVTRMIDDERRKHFEQERGHFESRPRSEQRLGGKKCVSTRK